MENTNEKIAGQTVEGSMASAVGNQCVQAAQDKSDDLAGKVREDAMTENQNQNQDQDQDQDILVANVPVVPKDYDVYRPLTKLAIQNSLMIMAGKYGGGFFIKFIQDEGTAYGWYNFTIVYPDGSYKTLQIYKNYFKETDTESGNGVWTASPSDKKVKAYHHVNWDGPPDAENYTSMEMYTTPKMPIPVEAIWKKILENKERIPIVKIGQTASIEQLLAEFQVWSEENSKEYGQGFTCSDKECYITSEAFRDIVEQNGWNFSRARTELDLLGLFVKDNGTRGYQKAKRVGGTVKRFYVIRKDVLKAVTPPNLLEDVEYNYSHRTAQEKKITKLEKERDKYFDMYNDLAAKTGNDPIFA